MMLTTKSLLLQKAIYSVIKNKKKELASKDKFCLSGEVKVLSF